MEWEPAFWLPPFVGPWFLKAHAVARRADGRGRIEELAQALEHTTGRGSTGMTDLTARTYLVTGATRGVGRATAESVGQARRERDCPWARLGHRGAVCRATLPMARGGRSPAVGFASLKSVRRMAEEIATNTRGSMCS